MPLLEKVVAGFVELIWDVEKLFVTVETTNAVGCGPAAVTTNVTASGQTLVSEIVAFLHSLVMALQSVLSGLTG